MQSSESATGRARKPMYEDEHAGCSVLLAKIRNGSCLLTLAPHDQFRWLHRFYLVLDRIAEQHRVYKLYGGPHGFMISTGVAEPDADHAATLLRFSLHVLQAAQNIRLPGQVPVDLLMVLASGPASSGLLGTTSLTYQIVGRTVSVARELLESQKELPFLITGGMFAELKRSAAAELVHLGSVQLTSCPGEEEAVYTLERYGRMQLSQPAAAAAETAAAEAEAASSDSQEDADALTPTAVAAAAHPGSSREVSAARTAPASPEPAPPLPSATPHSSSSSDGSIGSAHAATTTTGSSPLPGKRQQQAAAAGGKGAAASSPGHPLPAAEQPPAAAPLVASLTTKG